MKDLGGWVRICRFLAIISGRVAKAVGPEHRLPLASRGNMNHSILSFLESMVLPSLVAFGRPRMRARRLVAGILVVAGCCLMPRPLAAAGVDPVVGQPLPAWQPGMLDIHQISIGGKGDSALFIFPDGTTMLLDVGEMVRPRPPNYDAPIRPNPSLRSGQWVAKYIQHAHPQGPRGALDYAVLTHFHEDHMGLVTDASPPSALGPYRLTGITDVAEEMPIRRVLDLGWPTYDFPPSLNTAPSNYAALQQWKLKHATLQNYRVFLEWQAKHRGLEVDRFRPGRLNQIRLQHVPARYPEFEIRNLAANGWVWTGAGEEARNRYPEGHIPDENNCSLAFRLSYGGFRYFNGGDMAGTVRSATQTWSEMESALAWVTGPVDAYALNHHGTVDSTNAFFLSVLQPRIHIVSVYASSSPDLNVMRRILSENTYPGPRDVFMTNGMWPGRRENMVRRYKEDTAWLVEKIGEIASSQGHVVLRVDPGGATYRVVVVDDSRAPPGPVSSVHGPYPTRKISVQDARHGSDGASRTGAR
jgi:beta-lactamase superfamily II metal-dependent hydrolase